jgi:Family of unknown function (DUF6088)
MNNERVTQSLRGEVLLRVSRHPNGVWTPGDFVDPAGRDAIDKTLQRLAKGGNLRRIERGLYDLPSFNSLTSRQTVPDYRAVIEAVARRDQCRKANHERRRLLGNHPRTGTRLIGSVSGNRPAPRCAARQHRKRLLGLIEIERSLSPAARSWSKAIVQGRDITLQSLWTDQPVFRGY